ncbi:MAG: DUF4469 domain-containing protein, partial [Dysgonamonadaceae bacterium]|nr:DUF4469 domain-containing protein [Dysgonamonadaceae bacterium]
MALDFVLKDVIHRIVVKFVPAYLPKAKKKYNARAVLQTELDIHGVASKASVYNITTPPKIIEEGFLAAEQLITYLVADNYRIKTDLFHLGVRIPGEYDGTETHLPQGLHPEVRMTVDDTLRNYIRDHVHTVFDGIEENNGYIGEVVDEATGTVDKVFTPGNILAVYGYGLKIEADEEHADQVGVFLVDVVSGAEVPFQAIAQNEPRTLKLLSPQVLPFGATEFRLVIRTQSSAKSSSTLLKEVREVSTDFLLKP